MTTCSESPRPLVSVEVLIVDDDEETLRMLEALLDGPHRTVITARSGEEALRYLADHDEVALVILDARMDGMSGYETAALIRERSKGGDTPILFLTAHRDHADVARAYRLGAVDYLLKPPDPQIIRAKVQCFVELAYRTELLRRKNTELQEALQKVQDYDKLVKELERSKAELQDRIDELEQFEEAVVGRELKMIRLEQEVATLRQELGRPAPTEGDP